MSLSSQPSAEKNKTESRAHKRSRKPTVANDVDPEQMARQTTTETTTHTTRRTTVRKTTHKPTPTKTVTPKEQATDSVETATSVKTVKTKKTTPARPQSSLSETAIGSEGARNRPVKKGEDARAAAGVSEGIVVGAQTGDGEKKPTVKRGATPVKGAGRKKKDTDKAETTPLEKTGTRDARVPVATESAPSVPAEQGVDVENRDQKVAPEVPFPTAVEQTAPEPSDGAQQAADTVLSSDDNKGGRAAAMEDNLVRDSNSVKIADLPLTGRARPQPKRGYLRRLFNAETGRHIVSFAVGMGTSMALSGLTRTAVLGAATAAGLSTAPAMIAAGLTAGFVLGNYRFFKQRRAALKAGSPVAAHAGAIDWKQYSKTVLASTVLAGAGGAFAHYCAPGILHFLSDKGGWGMDKIHHGLSAIFGHHAASPAATPVSPPVVPHVAPPVVAPPPVIHGAAPVISTPVPAPVPVPVPAHVPAAPSIIDAVPHAPAALDQLRAFAGSHHMSHSMHRLVERALHGNAQAQKDMAYFLFNGFHGMPKDQGLAMTLFHHAGALGNVQANVDLAYVQYHGLAGVTADHAAAMAKMQALAPVDHRAARLLAAWKATAGVLHHHAHHAIKYAVPTR